MARLQQSPHDPDFVQNPYAFYAAARRQGDMHIWADYDMPAAFSHAAVSSLLRDRRFGRQNPAPAPIPPHLASFYAVEEHSLLELEPPEHTRLRALVTRAFTSRAIAGLAPEIARLCDRLIADFPRVPFDLLAAYCTPIPVLTIARLLGVPESAAPDLLRWSHAMVAMYQSARVPNVETAAAEAARDFTAYLKDVIAHKRRNPCDDLMTHLSQAETEDGHLTTPELVSTSILLLNAGHEATVHSLALAVKTLIEQGANPAWLSPDALPGTIEECLRFDPPLHMFTRYAYETVTIFDHRFAPGDQVALLLGAANRDPAVWPDPDRFDPARPVKTHTAFGAGLHFCLGAPLARLEMQIALPRLFAACPDLALVAPPEFAPTYHFHGLTELRVTC